MVTTRQGTALLAKGNSSDNSAQETVKQSPVKKRNAPDPEAQQQGRAKKRKSSPGEPLSNDVAGTPESAAAGETQERKEQQPLPRTPQKNAAGETQQPGVQQPLPRLTTPDLEFDWDRSQLKDPRPTPGREARPRYDKFDIPAELAARRPPSPKKPKGRLNAMQKDALFGQKTRTDPTESFHDLYKCRDKGRNGSPTYDSAGFRLDYDKVMNWFEPRAYNKKAMVNGMEEAFARAQSLEEHMMQAFFEKDARTREEKARQSPVVEGLVMDTISKDLGVPRHKIGHAEIDMWEQRGFQKHKVEDWLTFSNEDQKRHFKMLQGERMRA